MTVAIPQLLVKKIATKVRLCGELRTALYNRHDWEKALLSHLQITSHLCLSSQLSWKYSFLFCMSLAVIDRLQQSREQELLACSRAGREDRGGFGSGSGGGFEGGFGSVLLLGEKNAVIGGITNSQIAIIV